MLSDQLPIYNVTYDLTKTLYTYTKNFNRIDRILIGERMVNNAMDMLSCILNANSHLAEERIIHLNDMKTLIEEMKTLIRFCIEMKIVSSKQSATLATKLANIGKQLTGWRKSTMDKLQKTYKDTESEYFEKMQKDLDNMVKKIKP